MLFIHKTNNSFMFHTDKWLRSFNKGKIELETELVPVLKKTLDYQAWLIYTDEKIEEPIIEEIEVEEIIKEELVKKPTHKKKKK